MKRLAVLLPFALSGCVVGTIAKTAVDVVTIPVTVASAGVDAAKRGRELRKQDEARGRLAREMQERCQKGRAVPTDDCAAVPR